MNWALISEATGEEEEETHKLLFTYEDLLSRVPIKGSSHYNELIP